MSYSKGDKFVIEIECAYKPQGDTEPKRLYKIKGFNSLVFDENGLDKLRPFQSEWSDAYEAGYDKGFEDLREKINETGCVIVAPRDKGTITTDKGLDLPEATDEPSVKDLARELEKMRLEFNELRNKVELLEDALDEDITNHKECLDRMGSGF